MADLLIVGSVAFDSVKTPFGSVDKALGGAAVYSSVAAGYFCCPAIVGVVGDDYPQDALDMLQNGGIDVSGVERMPGETFFWKARYEEVNTAITEETRLGVFASFKPKIPQAHASSPFLFLANIDPELQLFVLDQMRGKPFIGLDTMNFWIESKRDTLIEVIKRVQLLLVNDTEARMLTGQSKLTEAGAKLLDMGPEYVLVKKGEHGALSFSREGVFCAIGHPDVNVKDPTGAGDTFAGGLMGYLAKRKKVDDPIMRQAVIIGTTMASYDVEDFSFNRTARLTMDEIKARYREIVSMTQCFDVTLD